MLHRTKVVLAALAIGTAGLAGCTTSEDMEETKLAANAGAATQPSIDQAQLSSTLTALVKGSKLRVLNSGKMPVRDMDIWINGTYLYHADEIPAVGFGSFDLSKFYDKTGHSFTAQNTRVDSVQIRTEMHLWTLQGPIVE